MDESLATPLIRRLTLGFFLGALLLLAWAVLRPFVVPVLWAGILAFVTWPVFQRILRWVRSPSLASLLTTLLVATLIIAPLVWMTVSLRGEVLDGYQTILAKWRSGEIHVPRFVLDVPFIGNEIRTFLDRVAADPDVLGKEIAGLLEDSFGEAKAFVGGLGRNLAKLFFALLTMFFLYRNGEQVLAQFRQVLKNILGERVDAYFQAAGATTRAVVYGIVLTAIVQGAFAGLGYWAVGLEAPLFLTAITILIALVPFGTPVVWISLSIWLLAVDRPIAALSLFLYGALVVSWVDNLVRPLVISSATRIPFLLVLFGVLGGVAAFGLIGLFIGPVILAVLMSVWREWLEEHTDGLPAMYTGPERRRSRSAGRTPVPPSATPPAAAPRDSPGSGDAPP